MLGLGSTPNPNPNPNLNSNLFDLSQPDSLPRDLKIAQGAFGGIFELLQRQFGFQEGSPTLTLT